MARIISAITILIAVLLFTMCERADMYDLATTGAPPKTAIYLFATILPYPGDLGGRMGADEICYNEGIIFTSLIRATNVKAFLSVSPADELRFLVPSDYWLYPVIGIAPGLIFTPISPTWLSMIGGTYSNTIDTSLGLASYWWSGSNGDGSISPRSCMGFEDGTAAQLGELGGPSIDSSNVSCDVGYPLVCVAY
jgi:hypothetical protein